MSGSTNSLFRSTTSIPHPHRLWQDALADRLRYVEQENNRLRGRILPSGKGSIGYAPAKKLSSKDKKYESQSSSLRSIEYERHPDDDPSSPASVRLAQKTEVPTPYLPCQEFQPVAIPQKRVARRLTRRGKSMLHEGCFCLEQRHGVKNLGFYTLTLSFEDPELIEVFNQNAATILKRYLEKLRRLYARRGVKFSYCGAWELHPSRSARCQIPILHFHYVANCYYPNTKRFVVSSSRIRAIWSESVKTGIGDRTIRTCRIGSEVCRVSSAGYLAKYVSKNQADSEDSGSGGCGVRLSSWYSIGRSLLQCIRGCTTHLGGNLSQCIVDGIVGGNNLYCIEFAGCVRRIVDEVEYVVGYWFSVTEEFHRELVSSYASVMLECLG